MKSAKNLAGVHTGNLENNKKIDILKKIVILDQYKC